jgi:hypothetical protein
MSEQDFSSAASSQGRQSEAHSLFPDGSEPIDTLLAQLHTLQASVEALRAELDEQETAYQELLAENQQLRRAATVTALLDDLDVPLDEEIIEDIATPPLQRLYRRLPGRFRFPAFFRAAEDENLDTAQARRYLARYLADGSLVQSGAHLEKPAARPNDASVSGEGGE